jgi:hypothetical protein
VQAETVRPHETLQMAQTARQIFQGVHTGVDAQHQRFPPTASDRQLATPVQAKAPEIASGGGGGRGRGGTGEGGGSRSGEGGGEVVSLVLAPRQLFDFSVEPLEASGPGGLSGAEGGGGSRSEGGGDVGGGGFCATSGSKIWEKLDIDELMQEDIEALLQVHLHTRSHSLSHAP